ncbi:MAG: LacI family DNA-binding transcriptional regulator [Flavobacterium sp.]|nr:LacI family DNA-binding transcriptional regulator [Flavobacterium sp.]
MVATTTLKKISEMLNISISTVSRALKNHPDISERTKQKVNDLATMLDYEPNPYAIQLSSKTSKVLGLIVPKVSDLFYTSFIDAVEEESRKNGYSLIILKSDNDVNVENSHVRFCKKQRVAGVFASVTPDTENLEVFERLKEVEIPVIFYDRVPSTEKFVRACFDDKAAAILAAETILAKKKKKVLALFGDTHISITQQRLEAFKDVFKKHKSSNKLITAHSKTFDESIAVVTKHFSSADKPDTIFCMSDEIMVGAMKALQILQLSVPRHVSIITISNDGFYPKLYHPEITYIETSGYKLGKLAFETMIKAINGDKTIQEYDVAPVLVEGGSLI